MAPVPMLGLFAKSPLVRREIVCAASGASCKKQRDLGAIGSPGRGLLQEAGTFKSDGIMWVG